mmetsp:Transcript_28459/g.33104  ORF Transcript_28459/g.33104 Transcript_28459/m.33104 type:complete len:89 (-) Transcript_28459:381-647(-)
MIVQQIHNIAGIIITFIKKNAMVRNEKTSFPLWFDKIIEDVRSNKFIDLLSTIQESNIGFSKPVYSRRINGIVDRGGMRRNERRPLSN